MVKNLPHFIESIAGISYASIDYAREQVKSETPIDQRLDEIRHLTYERGPFVYSHPEDITDCIRKGLLKGIGHLSLITDAVEALTDKQTRRAGRSAKILARYAVRDALHFLESDDIAAQTETYKEILPLLRPLQRLSLRARLLAPSIRNNEHRAEPYHEPQYGSGWADDSFWIMFYNFKASGEPHPETTCPNVLVSDASGRSLANSVLHPLPILQ